MRSAFLQKIKWISLVFICFIFQTCTKPQSGNNFVLSTANEANITGTIPDGTYKISPDSNKANAIALTIQSVDDNVLTRVKKYIKDSTVYLWHFTKVSNGLFRISNAYSGKVLSAPSDAAIEGQRLLQSRYDTSGRQLWRFAALQDGAYKFTNKATGLCITRESNNNLTQRSSSGTLSQAWNLFSKQAIYVDVDAVNFFRRTKGWVAGDGASSILMNDGRVAWFFGDSHIDDYFFNDNKVYCLFQVRNAAMIQPSAHSWNWQQTGTLTGNPFPGFQSYFKNKKSDDYWMWPARGFQLQGNDTVYVYNSPLKKSGDGQWDFVADSFPLWGKIRSADMKVVGYSLLQDFNGIDFGMGFIKENDGYIYAFGSKQTFIVANVFVARFPANDPNAKWMFWTGSGWSENINDIKRISQGATNSVNVIKYNNKYLIFSTEFSLNCDMGTHIYVSAGDSPTGTFTERKIIYEIPDKLEGHSPLFYVPNAHPEFSNDGQELLLTYNINGYGDCVNTCKGGKMDPDSYRPKAVRIPFSLIADK